MEEKNQTESQLRQDTSKLEMIISGRITRWNYQRPGKKNTISIREATNGP